MRGKRRGKRRDSEIREGRGGRRVFLLYLYLYLYLYPPRKKREEKRNFLFWRRVRLRGERQKEERRKGERYLNLQLLK